jgi:hypothetical protein
MIIPIRRLWAFALLAAAAGSAGASPAERPELQIGWRLGFGGATLETGYDLALSYRSDIPDAPHFQAVQLDVSDRAAFARFAGWPVFGHDVRAAYDETAEDHYQKPWYARSWVWWTAGALVTTTALVGAAGGGGGDESSSGDIGVQQGSVCVMQGGTVADEPLPEACTEQVGTGWTRRVPGALRALDPAPAAGLEDGTGGMGDLIAR